MKNVEIRKLSLGHVFLSCGFAVGAAALAMACTLVPAQADSPLPEQEKPAQTPVVPPKATTEATRNEKQELQLVTYDFYKLMAHRAPKVKHDLKRALEVATAVYAGKEIPRQPLTKAQHARFAEFLMTILQLGDDVEIVPGKNGRLVVLASKDNHRVLSEFRDFSLLSLVDKQTSVALRIEAVELTPRAFDQNAIPLLKQVGVTVGAGATTSTLSRSDQQKLFAGLFHEVGVKELASADLVATNLIPRIYSQLKQTAYVKDYNVEVSNAVLGIDPIVDVVKHGRAFAFTAARLDSSRLAVILQVEQIHLKTPIPTFTTTIGVGQQVSIQLPDLRITRRQSVFHLPDPGTTGLFISSTQNKKRLIISVIRTK